MAKYMSIPYEAALRTYDTSIPVFVSAGMLSEDFQDKVLDFEFNAMGMEKKLPRNKVFDFSIMKSLAAKRFVFGQMDGKCGRRLTKKRRKKEAKYARTQDS